VSTGLGILIAAVTAFFVIRTLVHEWSRVRDALADAGVGWLALAVFLAMTAMTAIASPWRDAIALLAPEAPARGRTTGWYFVGELGKYLPGGVWPVLGRGELARRNGVPGAAAYASVALSLAALYLAAMLVALVLVPFDLARQAHDLTPLLVLVLLPVGLVALHPWFVGRAVRVLERASGRVVDVAVPRWSATLGLVLRYVPAWVFVAGATWCVARALDPSPPLLRVALAAVLSWIAGFVAVPVPAGAGVREAVFVAVAGLPAGIGAATAIAARLAFVAADVTGAVAGGASLRRRR
jgi:uncharacterized membrane protein YbhN (UPF0104 family)